jgi:hypothetical protein
VKCGAQNYIEKFPQLLCTICDDGHVAWVSEKRCRDWAITHHLTTGHAFVWVPAYTDARIALASAVVVSNSDPGVKMRLTWGCLTCPQKPGTLGVRLVRHVRRATVASKGG